jgi:putative SOS response-associated peptidase YedK
MCGRFTLHTPVEHVTQHFGLASCPDFAPRYNIAPTSDVLVIRRKADTGRVGQIVRWGLVPSWSKDPSIGAKLNNARGETVDTKPSFRTSFAKHRCLIPASGFYEWKPVSEGSKVRRQPFYIRPTDENGLFAFAGLLARWRSEAGDDLITTCIITTGPNAVMAPIHDRMPVILTPGVWDAWLGAKNSSTEALKGLLVPAPAEGMAAYPVSSAVNRAGVEGEELILPLVTEPFPSADREPAA